ncbi:hypothetical protein QVD17_27773 [Tagetes erecta]|uniref:Myb-related protein 123 n=1 Tax=Tagetes erecta TaxID=13708 RepID=A0AAD8KBM6_TARER|nr:hypothetical protein QVD17_27773 [Tagetes erecta]
MGRSPCCSKTGLNRGSWTASEDKILTDYITLHGEGKWRQLPIKAGLMRCGKSCRLRWLNYLKPDIKRGNISSDEEDLIIRLHKLLGNRWSLIAGRLPGRTDNEIKNYWNTTLAKKVHDHHNDHINHAPEQNFRKRKDRESVSETDKKESNLVRTKAVRCSRTYTTPHPQIEPPRSYVGEIKDPAKPIESAAFPFYNTNTNGSSYDLDVNMEVGVSLTGLSNLDFTDMFNLNDGLVKRDDMMSGSATVTGDDTDATQGFSKEILDYSTWMIHEVGGEWLYSK